MIASAGIHLSVAVLLLVGPGFLSSKDTAENQPVLDFIPTIAIEGNATGGGGPRMRPPSPTPQPPVEQPAPPPPPQPQQQAVAPTPPKPQPVKTESPEPPKITQSSPDAFETPKPRKHKIVPDLDVVKGSERDAKEAKAAKAAAERAARQAAEAQRQLASAFNRVTRDLKTGFSGGTDVKFNDGFGGTGPAYANWLQIVQSIYFNDWKTRVPPGVTDDSASGVAKVTIARDGTVISSRITESSGNPTVDRLIQATLDRVKFTIAFPESSKEEQTEIEIEFSVKAVKQLMG